MGWTKQAKKDAVGKWLKFDEEHPSWTMLFLGDPQVVEKVSTMGDRKGEKYNAYEFPVEVEGEEKILSVTQRSLLRQLIEEEEEEMFPDAAKELSAAEEDKLAKLFARRKPAELARAEAED